MNILLDTHTFIWWDSHAAKLSRKALECCQAQNNTLLLSVVSVWEIQIKHQLGKLTLKMPLRDILETQQRDNGIRILPIAVEHILALEELPMHHRDPFDRLLIAQAKTEQLMLLSCDPIFQSYPVQVMW